MADPVSTTLSVAQLIVPSVEPVIKRLLEERREKKQLVKGLEKEIPRLFSNMQDLKDLLRDAEKKEGQSEPLRRWLMSLKEVVYNAEDFLDEYATDVAIWEMKSDSSLINSRGWRAKVSRSTTCCFTSHPYIAGQMNKLKFAIDIKNINRELDDLYKKRSDLGLQVLLGPGQNPLYHNNSLGWRKTTSIPDHFQLEGREEVKREILKKLSHELGKQGDASSSSNHEKMSHISIIPIVGMGGLGKTTLTRSIFNDDDVKVHFGDSKAWVCVSENVNVENLTKAIIESIYCSQGKNETCKCKDLENMQKELVNLVEGKHFLLILDDVWSEDVVFWESILKPLRAVKSGCRHVVLTTRNVKIRDYIQGCMDNIVLKGLDIDQLWKVFHMYAFEKKDENENNYKQLEAIGKTIVERLKGSPLAAKSIGRLLNDNFTPKYWIRVSKSELWKLKQEKYDIFPILLLSYQHLPTHLKQCLIYYSLFPKDYTFKEFEMTNLWMANGCIHTEKGRSLKDVGKMYLKALVDRTFLEYDHDRDSYSMHDLVHDMVQSISEQDCYWLNDIKKIKEENPLRFHHMSFIKAKDENFINEMCGDKSKHEKIRTMLFNGYSNFQKIFDMVGSLLETMRYLRALVFTRCKKLVVLPDSIYNLKLLRLLDISYTEVEVLSESLGNLYNLQVLNLRGCYRLKSLPRNTSRLVNLRHLVGEDKIFSSLKDIRRLRELRCSIIFTIRNEDGFRISELKDINLLEERLEIRNLELVKNKEHALQAQLEKKEELESLELKWTNTKSGGMVSNERMIDINEEIKEEEDVLEALKPCEGLIRIRIDGYEGMSPPSWLSESWLGSLEGLEMVSCSRLNKMPPTEEGWLNSLQDLELDSCTKLENLSPYLGRMQILRRLRLKSLHSLKEIRWEILSQEDGECCLFKALEDLRFYYMSEWVEWRVNVVGEEKMKNISIFPRLTYLHIERCPKLDYVDVPLLATMLKFPNKCAVGASTSYGNQVDDTVLTPYVSNGLSSLKNGKIIECPHIVSCDLLPTMTSLKCFQIEDCRSLTCLRFPTCATSMEVLEVKRCPQMISLDLAAGLIYVKRLVVEQCPNLESWKVPPPPTDYDKLLITRRDERTFVEFRRAPPPTDCAVFSIVRTDERMLVRFHGEFVPSEEWNIEFASAPKFYSSSSSLLSPPPILVVASNSSDGHGLFFPLPTLIGGLVFENLEHQEIAQLLTQIKACSVVNLKTLEIRNCRDLEHMEGIQLASPNLTASLTSLHLSGCAQLKSLPLLSHTLETVVLVECPLLPSSLDLRHATSLKGLSVRHCPSVASLLLPASISMDWLTIWYCPNLQDIISGGPHLMLKVTCLVFGDCNRGQLTILLRQIEPVDVTILLIYRYSDLEHFDADDGLGVQLGQTFLSFTSLRRLWIFGGENIKSLPSDLSARLLLLEEIVLTDCPLLSCLPDLRPLTSLISLEIKNCPLLSCFPDLRPLTSLRRLEIINCPLLTEKYKDDIRSQAFSHIDDVRIL